MKEIDYLCIEDDSDYCHFIVRATESLQIPINVKIKNEAEAALEFLREIKDTKLMPKIIFLDINLPDISGLEVLKVLKESNHLRQIPVIMLSSSENQKDISQSMDLGANAYVTKPGSYKGLKSLFWDAHNFWLNHNFTSLRQN